MGMKRNPPFRSLLERCQGMLHFSRKIHTLHLER
jgi:hypothetical protein